MIRWQRRRANEEGGVARNEGGIVSSKTEAIVRIKRELRVSRKQQEAAVGRASGGRRSVLKEHGDSGA